MSSTVLYLIIIGLLFLIYLDLPRGEKVMFYSMFQQCFRFLASSYLMPFWISCGGVIVAGAAAVALKGVFHRV